MQGDIVVSHHESMTSSSMQHAGPRLRETGAERLRELAVVRHPGALEVEDARRQHAPESSTRRTRNPPRLRRSAAPRAATCGRQHGKCSRPHHADQRGAVGPGEIVRGGAAARRRGAVWGKNN
ncbi:hypothetical protein BRADI_3g30505v3 [Brachypodium distachyon]|uniref:Uncharacterized protein n=1 Tax=Brachypodium distachyon TaxID=15368 RepID=A0A0Q3FH11_BRADI|nr:hypothetical protein BRADI_3g30505v3 [Brachypodium distachyon]